MTKSCARKWHEYLRTILREERLFNGSSKFWDDLKSHIISYLTGDYGWHCKKWNYLKCSTRVCVSVNIARWNGGKRKETNWLCIDNASDLQDFIRNHYDYYNDTYFVRNNLNDCYQRDGGIIVDFDCGKIKAVSIAFRANTIISIGETDIEITSAESEKSKIIDYLMDFWSKPLEGETR